MDDDVLYDTPELAKYLGQSRRTLEDWRRDKKGPDYVRLPKGVRYRREDVRRWLEEQVVKVGS